MRLLPMGQESTELARELARHPSFRWYEGMLAEWHTPRSGSEPIRDRVIGFLGSSPIACSIGRQYDIPSSAAPVLEDAATAGCLLALLRASLHRDARCGVDVASDGGAEFENGRANDYWGALGTTLGEACARALLYQWTVNP